jgi:hypothetical protein
MRRDAVNRGNKDAKFYCQCTGRLAITCQRTPKPTTGIVSISETATADDRV